MDTLAIQAARIMLFSKAANEQHQLGKVIALETGILHSNGKRPTMSANTQQRIDVPQLHPTFTVTTK
eukprot:3399818-Amphidinium_carterae.1